MTNIVTVKFQPGQDKAYTYPLYKNDYGQILRFEDLDLPSAFQVYFCNVGDTTAEESIGENGDVLIPTKFITTGKTIIAYLFLHTGESDGETVKTVIIENKCQPGFETVEPTPEEQDVIDQLIIALNNGVTRAEDAADGGESDSRHC